MKVQINIAAKRKEIPLRHLTKKGARCFEFKDDYYLVGPDIDDTRVFCLLLASLPKNMTVPRTLTVQESVGPWEAWIKDTYVRPISQQDVTISIEDSREVRPGSLEGVVAE
jgi:hypothetical protein